MSSQSDLPNGPFLPDIQRTPGGRNRPHIVRWREAMVKHGNLPEESPDEGANFMALMSRYGSNAIKPTLKEALTNVTQISLLTNKERLKRLDDIVAEMIDVIEGLEDKVEALEARLAAQPNQS